MNGNSSRSSCMQANTSKGKAVVEGVLIRGCDRPLKTSQPFSLTDIHACIKINTGSLESLTKPKVELIVSIIINAIIQSYWTNGGFDAYSNAVAKANPWLTPNNTRATRNITLSA